MNSRKKIKMEFQKTFNLNLSKKTLNNSFTKININIQSCKLDTYLFKN